MQNLLLTVLRVYFGLGGRIAPGLVSKHAFQLFCTPHRRSPPPLAARRVLDAAARFRVRHGDAWLQAYRWDPEGPASDCVPAVLLAHGWESQAARLTKWVEPLLAEGYRVVAFDAPAHGESEGRMTNPPDYAKALTEVAAAAGPFHAVVAHSLGVVATVLAVAGEDLIDRTAVPVDKLVLVAGPNRTLDAIARFADFVGLGERGLAGIRNQIQAASGHPVETFSVARMLAARSIPTLLLHDPRDDDVPYSDAEAIVAAVPSATLQTTDGLGHHRIMRDAAVIGRALAFLSENGCREKAVA